jgi:hypothetical protein
VTWTDNSGDHPERVDLSASLPAPPPPNRPDLVLTPNLIRFGRTQRPVTSTVTLAHDGETATARIDAVSGSGAFTIVNDRCTGRALGANETCTFGVRFQGVSPGRYRGKVTVVSTDSKATAYATTVQGTWVGAASPSPYVSRGRLNHRSFSPRVHDGRLDSVLYRFRSGIAHPSGRSGPFVTVEIWNGRFTRVVRTWTFHQRRAAVHTHAIRWNGRSDRGRLVRAGLYHVHAVVRAPETQGEGTRSSRWSTVRVRRGR